MVETIVYDDLAARLEAGTVVLLDAQAAGWFEREHLPGASPIDWDDITGSVSAACPTVARPSRCTAGTPPAPGPRSPPPSSNGSATATSTAMSEASRTGSITGARSSPRPTLIAPRSGHRRAPRLVGLGVATYRGGLTGTTTYHADLVLSGDHDGWLRADAVISPGGIDGEIDSSVDGRHLHLP